MRSIVLRLPFRGARRDALGHGHALGVCLAWFFIFPMIAAESQAERMTIHFRTQVKESNAEGFTAWKIVETEKAIRTDETAIVVCDMWEEKGCRAHVERIAVMAPMINDLIADARGRGIRIILAPSDITDYYDHTPARKRIQAMPFLPVPKDQPHANPPLPVETAGNTCDSESNFGQVERQHPAIRIDQEKDVISSDGHEIWNYLQHEKIKHVFLLGVHTNMCILTRPFAIQQMVKWGVNIALVRDATDASYNPFLWPYVDHETGTGLVVAYIEKFWCPSVSLEEIAGVKPISFSPWKRTPPVNSQPDGRIAVSVGPVYKKPNAKLRFEATMQRKAFDAKKLYIWETVRVPVAFLAAQTALIIQDMGSPAGHTERQKRMDWLAPRLSPFVRFIRRQGITVIHAGGGSVPVPADAPDRKRMATFRDVPLPSGLFPDGRTRYLEWLPRSPYDSDGDRPNLEDPPLPVRAFRPDPNAGIPNRQPYSDLVDPENDFISGDPQEIWNLFHHRKIENVLFAGFLTGESVLSDPVGVKKMVGWGVNTVVLKDLTVTDGDPDQPPYVNYPEGKNLLDGYLEKFWCMTAPCEAIMKFNETQ